MNRTRAGGVRIAAVTRDSPAYRAGLRQGDILLRVNGYAMRDTLDYMYAAGGEDALELEWVDAQGARQHDLCVLGLPDADLGVEFSPEPVRTCANKCSFCFVDQMPQGMRDTLYVKDDDWRSSFLHGTYVTLTNVSERDLQRIIEQRISPLYVSVHATDDDVRERMIGVHAARHTMGSLRRLTDSGIRIHAQCVVCEDVNDAQVLDKTIRDLQAMYPGLQSLCVVPVGLTRFRAGLPEVQAVSKANARRIVQLVETWQKKCIRTYGTRFVFAADELYLRSGWPVPSAEAYEDFAQIENGVGLIADFERGVFDEMNRISVSASNTSKRKSILFLTGTSFAPRLQKLMKCLEDKLPIEATVRPVVNQYFGPTVTVAGLLTGHDILRAMSDSACYDAVCVPGVMFRDAVDRTLDDMPYDDIAAAAGTVCLRGSSEGESFVRQIASVATGTEGGPKDVEADCRHRREAECW